MVHCVQTRERGPPSAPAEISISCLTDLIRDTLNNILGSSINDQQWAQVQLSVAMGGLGLRGAVGHSAGGYVSSVHVRV